MTDRDYFAAAALTGLLCGRKFTYLNDSIVAEPYAEAAYGLSDAMLRQRERTNHDAAPAAKAEDLGTGDTPTLTDAERETLAELTDDQEDFYGLTRTHAKVLRGLLERTK